MKKAEISPIVPKTRANEMIQTSDGSHKIVDAECEFKISENCRQLWKAEYREIVRTKKKNNGKIICLYCSRTLKYSGRLNPNCKYKNLDDNFLDLIDTKDKAYFLGWIASDGTITENNTVAISIKCADSYILDDLRNIFCNELPLSDKKDNMVTLSIYSKNIANRVCEHLNIKPGKKSDTVDFPKHIDDGLKWHFIRGLFDGDGTISDTSYSTTPKCKIASGSQRMKNYIKDFCQIPCHVSDDGIEFWGLNALDFLGKMYDSSELYLSRKRNLYWDWASWIPALMEKGTLGRDAIFKWYKTHSDAVPPYKEKVTDSGWDLTLIHKVRQIGNVFLYGTGLKVVPDYGWYFDLVPRSSIIKTGYIMANSIGVIDRSYRGEIMAALVKFDDSMPELELPSRIVQIIPSPVIHAEFVEAYDLDDTYRGEFGFGSTGN